MRHGAGVGLAVVQVGRRLGWGKRRGEQDDERGKQARFDVGEHFVLAFLGDGGWQGGDFLHLRQPENGCGMVWQGENGFQAA